VGELIESKHIELVEVGAYNLPPSTIADKDEIIGNYARMPMLSGDYVLPEKISNYQIDPELDTFLRTGLKLVTVTPKGAAQAVASYLSPGDIVSVGTIHEERIEGGGVAKVVYYPEELSKLVVFGVENSRGAPIISTDDEMTLSSGQSVSEDLIPKTITFISDQKQVAMLIEAEYNGGFHLVFEERRAK
jgi:Flp pilus assembly protein CpaB